MYAGGSSPKCMHRGGGQTQHFLQLNEMKGGQGQQNLQNV